MSREGICISTYHIALVCKLPRSPRVQVGIWHVAKPAQTMVVENFCDLDTRASNRILPVLREIPWILVYLSRSFTTAMPLAS